MSSRVVACGKSESQIHGAWIVDGKSDVHVYDQSDMLVLGWNKNTDGMKFTHLALCFKKDAKDDEGKVTLQSEGSAGQAGDPEYFSFTGSKLDKLSAAFKEFLTKADQIARHG